MEVEKNTLVALRKHPLAKIRQRNNLAKFRRNTNLARHRRTNKQFNHG